MDATKQSERPREQEDLVLGISRPEYEMRQAGSPICNIPAEIIAKIFYITTQIWPQPLPSFTQVCRYLRTVAFGHSKLWSHVDLTNRKLARLYLDHCHGGPVHINYVTTWNAMPQFMPSDLEAVCHELQVMLVGFLDRIKSIRIYGYLIEITALHSVLRHAGPQVEKLVLNLRFETGVHFDWDPVCMPLSLKEMLLHCVSIPLLPEHCKNLVHLKLDSQPHSSLPSMGSFVDLLRDSRDLQTLRVTQSFPVTLETPPTVATLELPKLQQLHIIEHAAAAKCLLSHLNLSPTTDLRITTPLTSREDLVAGVLPRNSDTFPYLSNIRSLTYDNHSGGFELHIKNFVLDFHYDLNTPEDLMYDVRELGPVEPLAQFLERIPRNGLLEELVMKIDEQNEYPASAWRRTLEQAPFIKTLKYTHYKSLDEFADESWSNFHFCSVLAETQPMGTLLCPSLEKIVIKGLRFEDPEVSDDFEEFLIARYNAGLRLKSVLLYESEGLTERELERFRPWVDRLGYTIRAPRREEPPFRIQDIINAIGDWDIAADLDEFIRSQHAL